MIELFLLIIALLCFAWEAVPVPHPDRINLQAMGLVFFCLYFLYPSLLNVPTHHYHLLR